MQGNPCDILGNVTRYMMATFKFRGLKKPAVITREGVSHEKGLGEFFKRVDNLVWIKENSFYTEALEDCKERKKSLGEKLDRREKRVEELTNQIYNVVGFFSVFQGVILTAVTQLTQSTQPGRPLCGKVWFPVVLSGLSAIAAAIGIGLKYRHLNSVDKLIHNERLEQREAERREAELQGKGAEFKFKDIRDARGRKQTSYWLLKAVVVIGGVFAFTVSECPGKMVRVQVINGTEEEIVIKEGNAGIYREVQKIKKGGSHVVSVDEYATYREFVCVESKRGLTVTLTSDDCIDYSEVRIKYDENRSPKLYFEPTPRKIRGITEATTDANIGKNLKGASSWFTGIFRKK